MTYQPAINERIAQLEWGPIIQSLDERGFAMLPSLLTPDECVAIGGLYPVRERFRSRVDMARFHFGVGEYKYLAYPLPAIVAELRSALYARVAPVANDWMHKLHDEARFPEELPAFIKLCNRHGQTKPTPLILRYEAGGYNCMHQDIYGETVFPLQITFMLSRRGKEYEGGEFLLSEQRPRMQSRVEALTLEQGAAVLFTTRSRPVKGVRTYYRVNVRHGVSSIRQGQRLTLGIIFHDAK